MAAAYFSALRSFVIDMAARMDLAVMRRAFYQTAQQLLTDLAVQQFGQKRPGALRWHCAQFHLAIPKRHDAFARGFPRVLHACSLLHFAWRQQHR